jgi:uncharacterized protein (TIGR02265 family)
VGNIKASGVIHNIEIVRDLLGPAKLAELAATLPAPTRSLLERRLLPVEWIPVDDWMPFQQALLDQHFGGDESAFRKLVRKICERDFNTFYKVLIKLVMSPDALIERAAKLWSTYNDAGTLRVVDKQVRDGRTEVRLHVTMPTRCPVYGAGVHAYVEQLLQMAGARDLRVERQQRMSPAGLECELTARYV